MDPCSHRIGDFKHAGFWLRQTASCPAARAAIPVVVATVKLKAMPVEVIAVGHVEAYSTVSIEAQVPGQLLEVHFKEGDFVSKGQLLLTLDRRPYEAALAQAKATLARDKATAANNRLQAQRYFKASRRRIVPASQVESFTSAADASDAVVNADEAAIKTAELNLEYCTINSPIDGRTGAVMLKPGKFGEGCRRADRRHQSGQPDSCEFRHPPAILAGHQEIYGAGNIARQGYDTQGLWLQ